MSWQEGVAVALVLVGLMAGGYIAAQRPSFWVEFGVRIIKKLSPFMISYFTKRMPPEQEKAWRDCQRRGGKWNHIKRRCE
jgi:hypothetical protein